MDVARVRLQDRQKIEPAPNRRQGGFALIACLGAIPLLVGAVVALGTVVHVIQKRAAAQSLCLRQVTHLSNDLGQHLRKLTALNPQAKRLRRAYEVARRMRAALALTGSPAAIAAANAAVVGLQMARGALDAKQRFILARAELARLGHKREFAGEAAKLRAKRARLSVGYARALAVEARPPGDLAPEYVPVPAFRRRQAVTGTLTVPIAWTFPTVGDFSLRTKCEVTNETKEKKWQPRIVAASAPSKSRWSPSF